MAPRKSAAAAGQNDGLTLILIMEKGPLSGQKNDFRPGSLVHIGRLVRGNTLSIKDAGVSSKHLLIQFDATSDPESRRWTITDLGSSNGTVLNGEQLDPSEPAALSDGDIIKIGEETSIKVKIGVSGVENEIEASSVNGRRNARRRVRQQVSDLVVIKEGSELGLRNDEDEEEIEKVAAIEAKQEKNVNTRRTRNSAKNEIMANGLNVEVARDLGPSGTRGSRGVSTRRTRSTKKEENNEDNTDLGPNEITESRVSTRRTRNAKRDENLDITGADLSVAEEKKPRRGGRVRKKQDVETIPEGTEKEEPIPACEEEKGRSQLRVDEMVKEVKSSGTEGFLAGFSSSSGNKEGEEKMVPDLKNMTLGEWLDFLYVHEPQDIIAQTEEMLAEMRRKAERCHEFRLQHENVKAVE